MNVQKIFLFITCVIFNILYVIILVFCVIVKNIPVSEPTRSEMDLNWWKSVISKKDLETVYPYSKFIMMFSILKECEEIGDKVLVQLYFKLLSKHFYLVSFKITYSCLLIFFIQFDSKWIILLAVICQLVRSS